MYNAFKFATSRGKNESNEILIADPRSARYFQTTYFWEIEHSPSPKREVLRETAKPLTRCFHLQQSFFGTETVVCGTILRNKVRYSTVGGKRI